MESWRGAEADPYVYASTGELSYCVSNSGGQVVRVCRTGKEERCWPGYDVVELPMVGGEQSMLYCLVPAASFPAGMTSKVSEFT